MLALSPPMPGCPCLVRGGALQCRGCQPGHPQSEGVCGFVGASCCLLGPVEASSHPGFPRGWAEGLVEVGEGQRGARGHGSRSWLKSRHPRVCSASYKIGISHGRRSATERAPEQGGDEKIHREAIPLCQEQKGSVWQQERCCRIDRLLQRLPQMAPFFLVKQVVDYVLCIL